MESLYKNQILELVKPPRGQKNCWMQMCLQEEEEIRSVKPLKYKARLVAKGYSQTKGVDFNEVFSPVMKHTSICVLLAMVAWFDLELEQLDVKLAFLRGELEEQIFMYQSEGFIIKEKKTTCIC